MAGIIHALSLTLLAQDNGVFRGFPIAKSKGKQWFWVSHTWMEVSHVGGRKMLRPYSGKICSTTTYLPASTCWYILVV